MSRATPSGLYASRAGPRASNLGPCPSGTLSGSSSGSCGGSLGQLRFGIAPFLLRARIAEPREEVNSMAIKAQATRYFRVRGVKSNPKHGLALREAAKYGGPPALALIPEPANKYAPNAIRVVLFRNERRFHVGYVP